jgi:hypothetical protein
MEAQGRSPSGSPRSGSRSSSRRSGSRRSGSRRSGSRSSSRRSGSRRAGSRSGSRRSGRSSGSSSGSSPEVDVTVPQQGDGPEMLLWRATVDPVRNIGSPISAVWYYPGDLPNTADENRTSIKPAVERLMILTYPGGGQGYWTPGEAVENVSFLFLSPQSSQSWHPDIPGPEFDEYVVYHRTSMPLGKTYNSQYVPPQYYPMDRASELVVEVLQHITQDLYGKGKKYIKSYVKRYFVTPAISDEFTAQADRQSRNMIVDIFLRANRERHDEVEYFVEDEWEDNIRNDNLFDFIFFNENLLKDDIHVKMYNKKGKTLRPANKAELRSGRFEGTQYVPRFSPSPTSPSRRIRRRRTQRRRDKKIMKEYQALMESTKDNPSAVYDGGRRRRRTMRKK